MTKLNTTSSKKLIQKLKKLGFMETHQRGSHLYMQNADGTKIVTVPTHGSKDIPIGTLYNIVVRQAGISVEDFNKM